MTTYEPFHVTIVAAINQATQTELGHLAALVRVTKIPQDHDVIIAAWKARAARLGYGANFMGVLDSLLEQKAQAAAASASEGERKSQSAGAIMP
jgi:hypothetical protein